MLSDKNIHKLSNDGIFQQNMYYMLDDVDMELELLHAKGLEIQKRDDRYFFASTLREIKDEVFCIVDIETNGPKISKHQIIEIAAIKIQNGVIIDKFDSLVKCDNISESITKLTGISVEDTINAPKLKDVMISFKEFLADSVFVAHAVKFDFEFISDTYEKLSLLELQNRRVCTIDLAQRLISSKRYGLAYLNETLSLHVDATHHRALSDAISTSELFVRLLKLLPDNVKTTEELIHFSKHAQKLPKPKD
jgi:DNA polymerase-3 subunit epsilon